MRIEPYGYQYVHVQPQDCKEIVERTVLEGKPVERLFYREKDTVCPHPEDIPFLNLQQGWYWKIVERSMQNLLTNILQLADTRHWQRHWNP